MTRQELIDAVELRLSKMDAALSELSDEIAVKAKELFRKWEPGIDYVIGDRRRDNELLYKCVQAHTAQEDWNPENTPALWARVSDPAEEWPEWIQPMGAMDAYNTGDKVSHNGQHWTSTVDGNVWEPGVYGWQQA